ncbi:regulatory protein GemA [Rhodocyclus tenuis]|uniref:Regulatory protein GemA n=1 Tax=Rhodocyclus gracilis TaxID=2929842 RepID=A0ABX0WEI8_9RHOO|nr:regulatory protein GemA [Rhodocyclus gracilis]MRD73303.1 DUF1018 domain-containing protein [Rhodocyclus gracilis]NJA87696.1 regulatory protein GemA [Rhodocyclus gracilis]
MSDLLTHHRQLVGIAKGWALKNLPGWCDETHRDLLARHGATVADGRVSASTMTVPQLAAVLDDYQRRGWPRAKKVFAHGTAQAKSVPARISHMVRLWGRLGQAGKVEKATRPALLGFCARQLGREVADLDSLTVPECQSITEALKGWLGRA